MTSPPKASVSGFYWIGVKATIVGILVVAILNLATPLEFVIARFEAMRQGGDILWIDIVAYRFAILCLLAALACIPFLVILKRLLTPISLCLSLKRRHQSIPLHLEQRAKQRLINLPFIMVPVNLLFWIIIPLLIFGGAFALGRIDMVAAITFATRSTMVGLVSSAIVFFGVESYARKALIPFFFPAGELSCVEKTASISISRRLRAFYRTGSLIPLTNIVLTLYILYSQVNSETISAKVYGQGVLIFSLVVFILFFLGSGVLNRLISRSIADPINDMLYTMKLPVIQGWDSFKSGAGQDGTNGSPLHRKAPVKIAWKQVKFAIPAGEYPWRNRPSYTGPATFQTPYPDQFPDHYNR